MCDVIVTALTPVCIPLTCLLFALVGIVSCGNGALLKPVAEHSCLCYLCLVWNLFFCVGLPFQWCWGSSYSTMKFIRPEMCKCCDPWRKVCFDQDEYNASELTAKDNLGICTAITGILCGIGSWSVFLVSFCYKRQLDALNAAGSAKYQYWRRLYEFDQENRELGRHFRRVRDYRDSMRLPEPIGAMEPGDGARSHFANVPHVDPVADVELLRIQHVRYILRF